MQINSKNCKLFFKRLDAKSQNTCILNRNESEFIRTWRKLRFLTKISTFNKIFRIIIFSVFLTKSQITWIFSYQKRWPFSKGFDWVWNVLPSITFYHVFIVTIAGYAGTIDGYSASVWNFSNFAGPEWEWRRFSGRTHCCTANLGIWYFVGKEPYIHFVAQETRIIRKLFIFLFFLLKNVEIGD